MNKLVLESAYIKEECDSQVHLKLISPCLVSFVTLTRSTAFMHAQNRKTFKQSKLSRAKTSSKRRSLAFAYGSRKRYFAYTVGLSLFRTLDTWSIVGTHGAEVLSERLTFQLHRFWSSWRIWSYFFQTHLGTIIRNFLSMQVPNIEFAKSSNLKSQKCNFAASKCCSVIQIEIFIRDK